MSICHPIKNGVSGSSVTELKLCGAGLHSVAVMVQGQLWEDITTSKVLSKKQKESRTFSWHLAVRVLLLAMLVWNHVNWAEKALCVWTGVQDPSPAFRGSRLRRLLLSPFHTSLTKQTAEGRLAAGLGPGLCSLPSYTVGFEHVAQGSLFSSCVKWHVSSQSFAEDKSEQNVLNH